MEKKAIALIGVGATIAALILLSGVAYAASGSFTGQNTRSGSMMGHYGSGSSMMGRTAGYSGGMMGDNGNGTRCYSYMHQWPGSTSSP